MPHFATYSHKDKFRLWAFAIRTWIESCMGPIGWMCLGAAMSAMTALYLVVAHDRQVEARVDELTQQVSELQFEIRNPELAEELRK